MRLGENTVIAVVATDIALSKAETTKVAQMAQDGIARAVRPSHTMFDGDTVFAVSTGKREVENNRASTVTLVGSTAADVLARAIIHGVLAAETVDRFKCYRDHYSSELV